MTQTERDRIMALEIRLGMVEDTVKMVDKKLDEILILKAKGQGVFWLATALFGTSLAGLFSMLFGWIKG